MAKNSIPGYRLITVVACFLISLAASAQNPSSKKFPDTLNVRRLKTIGAIETATYVGGLSFLSFIWYSDQERVPFHWYDDSGGYLQMDKWGHAYGAYWESYAAYYALRSSGVSKKKSLLFGGPAGLVFQTPIEIFDGLYEGWGFSWSDMAANTFGSLLLMGQEALFDEQVVVMKFTYSPSGYPKYHHILGETPVESFFKDYNGHTYWLSCNLKRVTGIEGLPVWLNFALGYSGNGMINEFENPDFYRGEPFPDFKRYRQFVFSLDIDLSRLQVRNKYLNGFLNTLNVVKIPFPAVEINRIEGFTFHALYY